MAINLIVEDGSIVEGANCDFSIEELDAYYETHLYAPTFTDAEHKKKAAITACRMLTASVTLKGSPKAWDQPRPFPRTGVVLPVDPLLARAGIISGEENIRIGATGELPSNVVPQMWKDACMEFVRFVVLKDRSKTFDTPAVVKEKIDVIEREFSKSGNAIDLVPEIVQRMVSQLVVTSADQGATPGAGSGGNARSVQIFRS